MNILIAEDDLTSRTVLKAALNKWGYGVVCTCDGEEAWGALQEPDSPQIAILDWMMPVMDGPALCRRLRAQDRQEPLYMIILTSRGESSDIVEGLEAGADDYVAKPYNNAELRARVEAGRRMIDLQNRLREKEKLQGVLEMAGAVCHELNQPLQTVLGMSELMLMETKEDHPLYSNVKDIKDQIDRMGRITNRLMNITEYRTKSYLKGKIIDLNEA
jgi:DNA-binding response OmpR family regulator